MAQCGGGLTPHPSTGSDQRWEARRPICLPSAPPCAWGAAAGLAPRLSTPAHLPPRNKHLGVGFSGSVLLWPAWDSSGFECHTAGTHQQDSRQGCRWDLVPCFLQRGLCSPHPSLTWAGDALDPRSWSKRFLGGVHAPQAKGPCWCWAGGEQAGCYEGVPKLGYILGVPAAPSPSTPMCSPPSPWVPYQHPPYCCQNSMQGADASLHCKSELIALN